MGSAIFLALGATAVILVVLLLLVNFLRTQTDNATLETAQAKENLAGVGFKSPPKNPSGTKVFNPDEAVSFDKDYQALFQYFKQKIVIRPDKDPYAFHVLAKELILKFMLLGLTNPESDIKNKPLYGIRIKPRVEGTSVENWEDIVRSYNHFREEVGVRLSEYVFYVCSMYSKALTGNLLFKSEPVFSPLSNYSTAITSIARQTGSDNVHNDRYGPAILLYYTIHMHVIVKILENQKQLSLGNSSSQAYLKYLEDELGLTKLDIDQEARNFITPPTSPINTDVSPQRLIKGIIADA